MKEKGYKLFDMFLPVSRDEWQNKIECDLKGREYNSLIWKTTENIIVQPFYCPEDINKDDHSSEFPGNYPFRRGNKRNGNFWEIRQDFVTGNIQESVRKATTALKGGVDALGFISTDNGGFKDTELAALLHIPGITAKGINLVIGDNPLQTLKTLISEAGTQVNGSISYDVLERFAFSDSLTSSPEDGIGKLADMLQYAGESLPGFRLININGRSFVNAGASVIQELAYSLSLTVEYFSRLLERGLPADYLFKNLQLNAGVGSNYFFEIAKLRAARVLWANLASAYSIKSNEVKPLYVNSITGRWNKTVYDPAVNLLRLTSEAMSAVLGGCDSLVVEPFDICYKLPDDFSERLARNIQIIIREEAYLGEVTDPAAGSYYIENITDAICENAWKLFLEIESKGGFLAAFKEGFIQSDISKTVNKKKEMISSGKDILVGTNKYTSYLDNAIERFDESYVETLHSGMNNNPHTINMERASWQFEKLRMAIEKHPGDRPKVFLLTTGDVIMRRARADFAANFFGSAGYKVIDNAGFSDPMAGLKAAHEANADIIVVCSSDDDYALVVPSVQSALTDNKPLLVVAGKPPCAEILQQNGEVYFISIRTDMVKSLNSFSHMLGIFT